MADIQIRGQEVKGDEEGYHYYRCKNGSAICIKYQEAKDE
jgi:hypothetical protein